MLLQKFPYVFSLAGIWLGFVGAISFMEAWLKFKAPGIDIPLGLGIGRLVFNALNKVEWVCLVLIVIQFSVHHRFATTNQWISAAILLIILLAQTFWLLPILDSRAELIINHQPLPPSNFHFYYVALEITKVSVLFILLYKMIVHKGH